jgi:ABC-type sugar transport system permease subunit
MAVISPSERLQEGPQRSGLARWLGRDYAIAWPFMLPLLAVLIGLIAYPFVSAVWLSLNRKVVGADPVFIGAGNFYELLFGDQYGVRFRKTVQVSFLFVAVSIALKFFLGMCMALLLNERFRGRSIMRGILFIPWAMPSMIVALSWKWIYEGSPSGLINKILINYFGSDTIIQFLANPKYALWSVIFAAIWQGTPFWTIMFLAGLQAIPGELYEAAKIDGANAFQRYLYVTLPQLRGVIIVTSLLSTIWTANSINFIYVLTRGGPADATMTFPMLAYEIGPAAIGGQLGLASAVSVLFFPVFIIAIFILTKRMLSSDAKA